MNNRQLTVGIILVVVSVLGTLIYRTVTREATVADTTVPEQASSEPERSTQVKAVLMECNKSRGARTIARGQITNIGNVDLHYVTVRILWLNSMGMLVEANETYALNNDILLPGETREFTDTTRKVSAVTCNVETIDWW